MKFKDIESKSINELNDLLNDLKAESFALGWKNKTQQQDQTHKIKLVRRDIARVLTALKQKELNNEGNNQKPKTKKTTAKKTIKKSTSASTKKKTAKATTKKVEEVNQQKEGVK